MAPEEYIAKSSQHEVEVREDEQVADTALATISSRSPLEGAQVALATAALAAIENTPGYVIDSDLLTEKNTIKAALRRETQEEEQRHPKKGSLQEQVEVSHHIVAVREDLPEELTVRDLLHGEIQEAKDEQKEERVELTEEMFMAQLLKGPFKMKSVRLDGTPEGVTIEDGEFEVADENDIELVESDDPRIHDELPLDVRMRVQGLFQVIHGKVTNTNSTRPGSTTFSGGIALRGSGIVVLDKSEATQHAHAA